MNSKLISPRFLVLCAMIAAAAFTRLIPHLPNFTAIGAMALFGGAYFSNKNIKPIESAYILLWGPLTNVFYSWYSFAEIIDFRIYHYCHDEFQISNASIEYVNQCFKKADVIITDGWTKGFNNTDFTLSKELYNNLGEPFLLPTPPFTIGKEISFDPVESQKFVGYEQKKLLLDVQSAILQFLLKN